MGLTGRKLPLLTELQVLQLLQRSRPGAKSGRVARIEYQAVAVPSRGQIRASGSVREVGRCSERYDQPLPREQDHTSPGHWVAWPCRARPDRLVAVPDPRRGSYGRHISELFSLSPVRLGDRHPPAGPPGPARPGPTRPTGSVFDPGCERHTVEWLSPSPTRSGGRHPATGSLGPARPGPARPGRRWPYAAGGAPTCRARRSHSAQVVARGQPARAGLRGPMRA